jgi:hypothetical protein
MHSTYRSALLLFGSGLSAALKHDFTIVSMRLICSNSAKPPVPESLLKKKKQREELIAKRAKAAVLVKQVCLYVTS